MVQDGRDMPLLCNWSCYYYAFIVTGSGTTTGTGTVIVTVTGTSGLEAGFMMAARWPRARLRWPQSGSNMATRCFKMPQDGFDMPLLQLLLLYGLRWPQSATNMATRYLKMA